PGGGYGKALLLPRYGDFRAERQCIDWRQLDRGAGEYECPQRRDLVGGLALRREQCDGRQPADILVGLELAPGPALFIGLVDRDLLAAQRLGEQGCVVRRVLSQRRDADDHLLRRALNETRRLDLAAQM